MFELMDVKETAVRISGRKSAIMKRDSLYKILHWRIETTAVPVF